MICFLHTCYNAVNCCIFNRGVKVRVKFFSRTNLFKTNNDLLLVNEATSLLKFLNGVYSILDLSKILKGTVGTSALGIRSATLIIACLTLLAHIADHQPTIVLCLIMISDFQLRSFPLRHFNLVSLLKHCCTISL